MREFRVVLTDQVFPDTTIEQEIIERAGGRLEVATGDHAAVMDAASTADAVLTTFFPLRRQDIERLVRCRVIARYGIGVDNVAVDAAAERGIVVTNVPDYCVEEVAVHALALALSLLRRLPAAHDHVLAGGWGIGPLRPLRRPSDVTFGLVGFGRIARRVAQGAQALGMRVVAHDPYVDGGGAGDGGAELVGLEDVFASSDVVSLHCPLTDATAGLVDAGRLSAMRPGAIVVNTSRGPLVRFDDLAAALRAGTIGGAGLDVFDTEPPDAAKLAGVPNLIVTPHVAYYSEASIRESQRKAATQVVKALSGEPVDYPVAAGP